MGMYDMNMDLIVIRKFGMSTQDGRINYDEFAAMMRKGNPDALTCKKRRDSIL